ncbi:MAG: leucine-rich repeat protein [Muribaculaceae bacterium]|nr:leucine-rich repeat protein [Muribaculaceae bacterium]
MKKVTLLLVLLAISIGQLFASERLNLLNETFKNVDGSMEATDAIDQSKFDNPSGWTFTNAFAGPQCVIIKKGGSITTPPIPELTGNAAFWFDAGWWEDPTGQTFPDWDDMKPHSLSLVGNGELSTNEYDTMASRMEADVIYDADASTRITLTAKYDIVMTNVCIYYAGNSNPGMYGNEYTKFSRESGMFFNPFNLTLTKSTAKLAHDDGLHNILVYTTDGTDPVRTSTRYEGTPILISSNTTVKTATIFGDGYMHQDKPRTYTFPSTEAPEIEIPANTFEVTVSKPGNLKAQLLDVDADKIEGLVLKGKINGVDLKYLIGEEGRTASLSYLDMSDLTFEYDNTSYRTVVYAPEAGMGTTTVLHYYLSSENKSDFVGGTPTSGTYNVYRNDLAVAFRGNNTLKSVVLPKILTTVGVQMFENCKELTFAQLPDETTSVGASAFYGCEKLSYVKLPESLTSVEVDAFQHCFNLIIPVFPTIFEKIGDGAFIGTKIGTVKIGPQVKIGESAFSKSSIEKLEIPYPTDTIPANAFAYCEHLEEIAIGEGLKFIGSNAFYYANIMTAQIPESILEISEKAFYGCPYFMNIEPEDGIRYIGKVAYEVTDTKRQEYTVKPGTVSLTPDLFYASSATTFNLPESLEIIGAGAFTGTQLTSIPSLPALRVIGVNAFTGSQLTSIPELPSLKVISAGAFSYCYNFARITIPESVEYIGSGAFEGCNALWSVTYNAINAECEGRLSPRDLERIVIGDKVRRLPAGLYTGNTNVTELILPKSVEILDPEVFSDCVNLEYIRLSDNISTISDNAFRNCYSLSDIHWSANLKTIGESAFRSCTSLKTISLPEGVESIGYYAFGECASVDNIYIASTITEFGSGCFNSYVYGNTPTTPITITATAQTPQDYEWNWIYFGPVTIKVPSASLAAYQNDATWNGSKNGKNNTIIPIEGISAPGGKVETSFNSGIDGNTDLGDTVIGDVYVTIGKEDGYDGTDGSIVLNSSMDEEYVDAIGGMAPGKSDLVNRFNGLVIQVPAGTGTVTINCLTIGTKHVSVKIGDEKPLYYTKDSKGEITVDYSVTEDTYVYIYANETETEQQPLVSTRTSATGSSVKIYSIGINPITITGMVDEIDADNEMLSPITEYYRIDGTRIGIPTTPGIYIVRRANGKSSKILIK